MSGTLPRLPKTISLQSSYPVTCPACNTSTSARPSLAMLSGYNFGGGFCPNCKLQLRLEISEDGTKLNASLYEPDLEPFVGEDYSS